MTASINHYIVASTKDGDKVERVYSVAIELSFDDRHHASLSSCSPAFHQKGPVAFESVVRIVPGESIRGGGHM
jgi:hypothetical protein